MIYDLQSVELEGFRGARGHLSVPMGPSFAIITGRNGSGKSTIIDAIEYALTGQLSRFAGSTEKQESIEDYLWWRTNPAKRHAIELRLASSSGDDITIRRARGESAPLLPADLFDQAMPPSPSIAELLGTTSIVRDETITRFSVDLSESERFQFVRTALGLSDWSSYEALLRKRLDEAKTLTKRYSGAHEAKRIQINDLTSQLSAAKAQASKTGSITLEQVTRRYHDLTDEPFSSVSEVLVGLQKNVALIHERVAALSDLKQLLLQLSEMQRDDDDKNEASLVDLSAELSKREEAGSTLSAKLIEAEKGIANLHVSEPESSAYAELSKYGEQIGLKDGRCPLCDSEVGERQFAEHINGIRKSLEDSARQLESLLSRRDELKKQINAVVAEINRAKSSIAEARAALATVKDLHQRSAEAAERLGVAATLGDVDKNRSAALSKLEDLESLRSLVQSSQALDRVGVLEGQIVEETTRLSELARVRADARKLEYFAQSAYDTSRTTTTDLIDERLASLEPLLFELYSRLKPHSEWSDLHYHRRGHVKGLLSFSVGENELNPRFLYSSGQRRALGLAFLLSVYLARHWANFQTLVLDDPIQHIDDYRALHLVETLASISRLDRQIVCAVEDPAIADLLCRRLSATSAKPGVRLDLGYEPGQGVRIERSTTIFRSEDRLLLSA